MARESTILVVDDNEDLRETVSEILTLAGYVAVTADSGRAALARLAEQPLPDLILLDLMMPEMDGWTFRALQKRDAAIGAIPVVIVTASRHFDAAALDPAEVLLKPFAGRDLLATVGRVIAAHPPPG
jgi:CheY-like chemotaxis protein